MPAHRRESATSLKTAWVLDRVHSELFHYGPGGFRTDIRAKPPPRPNGISSIYDDGRLGTSPPRACRRLPL